ncbi:MAM and LDL-receptor class A domain-containing protein 2 [Halotydeus destructor]|nr:MAM and LDL-receptor class A domain-containing protein 2 [Halotydeus destructor]
MFMKFSGFAIYCIAVFGIPVFQCDSVVVQDVHSVIKVLTNDFNRGASSGLELSSNWVVVDRRSSSVRADGPLFPSDISPPTSLNGIKVAHVSGVTNQTARISTGRNQLIKLDQTICFQFDFYIFGKKGNIELAWIDYDTSRKVLWYRDNRHFNYDKWHRARINLKPTYFAAELAFAVTLDDKTNIAFDSFVATEGTCDNDRLYCDFDDDSDFNPKCPWLAWSGRWTSMNSDQLDTEIPFDESSRSRLGRFLILSKGEGFISVSDKYQLRGDYCLSFWYFRKEAWDKIFLFEDKDQLKPLWTSIATNTWNHVKLTLHFSERKSFIFKTSSSKKASAIDSILLSPGKCLPLSDCAFDENMCSYSVRYDAEDMGPRWALGRGRLINPDKIPQFQPPAPPTGNGMYAYVDSTSMKEMHTETVLETDIALTKMTRGCLRFQYFQNGVSSGSTFYVETGSYYDNGDRGSPKSHYLVDKKPKVGQWIETFIDITRIGQNGAWISFNVDSYNSDFFLALSDVSFKPHVSCKGLKADKGYETGIIDVSGISCDFDNQTFCQWNRKGHSEDGNWKISNELHRDRYLYSSLPKFDHTKQSHLGYFIYSSHDDMISAPITLSADLAVITPGDYCMSLWSSFVGDASPTALVSIDGGPRSIELGDLPRSRDWTFSDFDFKVTNNKNELDGAYYDSVVYGQSCSH